VKVTFILGSDGEPASLKTCGEGFNVEFKKVKQETKE
jgi:hypothetical protein